MKSICKCQPNMEGYHQKWLKNVGKYFPSVSGIIINFGCLICLTILYTTNWTQLIITNVTTQTSISWSETIQSAPKVTLDRGLTSQILSSNELQEEASVKALFEPKVEASVKAPFEPKVCNGLAHKPIQRMLSINNIMSRTSNCSKYIDELMKIINFNTASPYKRSSPYGNLRTKLAFSYTVHNQPGLFEVLLHLTFNPYNAYCIYIGTNTDSKVAAALQQIVHCYQTLFPEAKIFLATNTTKVFWGTFSVLQADLTCFEQLLQLEDHPWEFAINLAGTELPLYTVEELSERLTEIKPYHKFIGVSMYAPQDLDRHKYKYDWECTNVKCKSKRGDPVASFPYGLKIFKGSKSVMVRRDFAHFMLHNQVSKDYLEFLAHSVVPDEHFYATVARIDHIEESTDEQNKTQIQVHQLDIEKNYDTMNGTCVRHSLWESEIVESSKTCYGKVIREICHFASDDLPELFRANALVDMHQNCFIANKFNLEIDASAVICLARTIHNMEQTWRSLPPLAWSDIQAFGALAKRQQ